MYPWSLLTKTVYGENMTKQQAITAGDLEPPLGHLELKGKYIQKEKEGNSMGYVKPKT